MRDMYNEKRLDSIFIKEYTWWHEVLWKKKRILRRDMDIKEITFPLFFALEVAELFSELYQVYKLRNYKYIASKIASETWISKLVDEEEVRMDLRPLNNIQYTLKNYQLEFVEQYNTLKTKSELEGYILSFDQGLGKTLTAVALAECLHKDKVYIVCPNSLKENWSYEIKSYFDKYSDDEKWKDEVYVVNDPAYRVTKNTKYFIVNQESIPSIFKLTDSRSNNMIIVDESHNFRNMKSKRTAELLTLKDKLKCKDTLMMSGTPIKATPNEIIPALLMIDPMFDLEVAKMYNRCFDVDSDATANIVQKRFGRVIYRKTKNEVLALPQKREHQLFFKIDRPEQYISANVKQLVNDRFISIYEERLLDDNKLREEFIELIKKYSSAPSSELKVYLGWVDSNVNSSRPEYLHELTQEEVDAFIDRYVKVNITNQKDLDRLDYLALNFINMKKSSMAKAIGEIVPKYRRDMYIDLFKENKKEIIEMIKHNPKKTVIFSTMLGVIDSIEESLKEEGIGVLKIVGGTKRRMEVIQQFKNDDTIDVLIATSQTLSTGVTLTEASQMLFFGTPWRSADYNQAADRIHRIGQTDDVDIYRVLLDTGKDLNLSTRMEEILKWSDDMFTSMINSKEL